MNISDSVDLTFYKFKVPIMLSVPRKPEFGYIDV